MFSVHVKVSSLAFPIYKYFPLFYILSILYTYIIEIDLNIINILDALIIINLFFKKFNGCGEMYFSRKKYMYIKKF